MGIECFDCLAGVRSIGKGGHAEMVCEIDGGHSS